MDKVLRQSVQVAKKEYKCDASYWWNRSGYNLNDCESFIQKQFVQLAEYREWKIHPGELYIKQVGIFEGKFCTYRARYGMHVVCAELDLMTDY